MKNDSDSERDELLCLNYDNLESVCCMGKYIDNDINNFKVILIFMKIIQVPYGKCRVTKRNSGQIIHKSTIQL